MTNRLAVRLVGWLAGYGWLVEWMTGLVADRLAVAGWLINWLAGCLFWVGWLVDCLPVWLFEWLAGCSWLTGWLT